ADAGLSDHAEGARYGVPHGYPAPLAPLVATARDSPDPQRGGGGGARVFLRTRLRADRLADPHRERGRRDGDAFRNRLLRREGLPVTVRTAVPRTCGSVVRPCLLFRPHVPRGKVEDATASDGVLDGRTGGRVPRIRRLAGAGRGVYRVDRRPNARSLQRR